MNKKIYDDGGAVIIIPIETPLDEHYNIYPPDTVKGISEEIVFVEKILDIPKTDKILAVPITIFDYPRELLGQEIWECIDKARLPERPLGGGKPYFRILIRMKADFLYRFVYE